MKGIAGEIKIAGMGNLANPTFPKRQALKYHRGFALSLLCSEWEEVVHAKLNHQETPASNFAARAG